MKNNITTTKSGFRVEDVTFRNARKQSEIINELGMEEDEEETVVEVPKSLTPEQVIKFYEDSIKQAKDLDSKRVYSQTIRWIKELQESKQELAKFREKELRDIAHAQMVDDIQELGDEDED